MAEVALGQFVVAFVLLFVNGFWLAGVHRQQKAVDEHRAELAARHRELRQAWQDLKQHVEERRPAPPKGMVQVYISVERDGEEVVTVQEGKVGLQVSVGQN